LANPTADPDQLLFKYASVRSVVWYVNCREDLEFGLGAQSYDLDRRRFARTFTQFSRTFQMCG
jgi:hypothetical protein